jgi:YbbR domain-containing protein
MMRRLTDNWILKLISLTFALILWFFVMGERRLEIGYAVPLETENVPAGLMIANDLPTTIDVRISGPRTLLMNLQPQDIRIAVDLGDVQPGVTSFKRLEERINLPWALRVTRMSPAFVDVRLERIAEKVVPVRPILVGTPAPGFRVTTVQSSPQQVVVEGAETELTQVNEVTTEAVNIEGAKGVFRTAVPLIHRGRYTMVHEKSAEVLVMIESDGQALRSEEGLIQP